MKHSLHITFPQCLVTDRQNVLLPRFEIGEVAGRASAGRGLVRRARNTLPLETILVCGRNNKNEYGRGPPKVLGYYRPNTRKPFCLDRVLCAHCHLE